MRRLVLVGVCLAALAPPARSHAQPPPPALTGAVNDFAGVIDARSAQAMDRSDPRAAAGDRRRVVGRHGEDRSSRTRDIQSYAVKMFENGGRGIGQREGKSDNGVLILLAVEDRQVRVEVGYDLEQFITDGFAGETSREAHGAVLQAGRLRRRLAGRAPSRSRHGWPKRAASTLPGVADADATAATQRRRISLVADPPSAVSDLHRAASGADAAALGAGRGAAGRAASAGSAAGSAAASAAADPPAAGSAAGSAASAAAGAAAVAAARHGRHACETGRQS